MISVESKILEKVVDIQLRDYLETNKLLFNLQSGFRNNHNCESLINLVVLNWKIAVHNNKIVVAVFLDLKRAFETLDKDILLIKLNSLGIKGKELEWFNSYIRGRIQRTRIDEVVSEARDVSLGVPQGTTLGVILFLIYINDIEKVVKRSSILLFADDTLLYSICDTKQQCIDNINFDLNNLDKWFKMNKMKLNIDKSKCMVLNSNFNDNDKIHINNDNDIEVVNEFKYLGVIFDDKLNFKNNLNYICKKLARKVNFLIRIRKNITKTNAIRIYNVTIKPHFDYCSSILFLNNNNMMDRLQKLQNKTMRCI